MLAGGGGGFACVGGAEVVVGDGADCWGEDGGDEALFAAVCWRSSWRILDVSGVTLGGGGGVFAAAEGFGSGCFGGSAFEGVGVAGVVFEAVFRATDGFAGGSGVDLVDGEAFGALVVTFAVLGAAFVDFALVVVFFAGSGTSTSTGSVMTFFGLPLFLAISADMLCGELVDLKGAV